VETKKQSDLEFLRQQAKESEEALRPFARQRAQGWARLKKKMADVEVRHTNQRRALLRPKEGDKALRPSARPQTRSPARMKKDLAGVEASLANMRRAIYRWLLARQKND
jgi:hypothetical protein